MQASRRSQIQIKSRNKIVILTAPIGGGHLSVARRLAVRLEGEGASVLVSSPVMEAGWLRNLPDVYQALTTTAFGRLVWASYYRARSSRHLRAINGAIVRARLSQIIQALDLTEVNTVVLTHSMYCHCISEFLARNIRVVVLVTDLFGGPREWFRHGADRYVVPSRDMFTMAQTMGVPTTRLVLRRLPTDAAATKSVFALDGRSELRVLLSGGSEGAGPMRSIVRAILRDSVPVSLTVSCGHNRRLQDELLASTNGEIEVLGYITDLPKLFSEYDLIITKPGSITLMEIVDARVPFVLMPGIPGIERGNESKLGRYTGVPVVRRAADISRVLAAARGLTPGAIRLRSGLLAGLNRIAEEMPERAFSLADVQGVGD